MFNWNYKIAKHLLKEEIEGEKKFGIDTTGNNDLSSLKNNSEEFRHSTIYMPASYGLLEQVFAEITPHTYKHFLDIGCGKGRVICTAAYKGFKKITGIEISKPLYQSAIENANKTMQHIPASSINVLLANAINYQIENDTDCIFMFNPFNEIILEKVLENIDESLIKNPRNITLIYFNSLYRPLLAKHQYEQVFNTDKFHYIQAAIFIKKA